MPNTAKFTKGEWFSALDGCVYATVGGDYKKISTVLTVDIFASKEEEANAHLIAASPEMYQMLVQMQTEGGLGIARHRQIDRLLAKARGEL